METNKSEKITRRKFLVYTTAGIGGVVLTCGGLGTLAFHRPVEVNYQKLATDRDPQKPAVLVAYATRAGSTMEIAQKIALELEYRGFAVDVRPIDQVLSLEGYSQVVIGSAIRMGAALPEAVAFVKKNINALSTIPVACFIVYLSNPTNEGAESSTPISYLNAIRDELTIKHEGYFTGVFDPRKLSFVEGVMGKMMKSPVGDFRDWKAISEWSRSIFPD